ncbi:hypothetical protein MRX96_025879 [Rhipicephalus microplus]
MPTTHRPPAVSIVSLAPGSWSSPAASRSPFWVEHTGAAPSPAASSWDTPASTGVSAAASGPSRSRPPIVHQGIMTVYLPVPEMLRCPYHGCAGC